MLGVVNICVYPFIITRSHQSSQRARVWTKAYRFWLSLWHLHLYSI